jgi:hypothetical protein
MNEALIVTMAALALALCGSAGVVWLILAVERRHD